MPHTYMQVDTQNVEQAHAVTQQDTRTCQHTDTHRHTQTHTDAHRHTRIPVQKKEGR